MSTVLDDRDYVAKQYEANQPIDIMVQDFVPHTIEDAYAVQASFLNLLQATPADSWKAGLVFAATGVVLVPLALALARRIAPRHGAFFVDRLGSR